MLQKNTIKYYRKMREMTQEELAEAADLSTSYISQLESGKKQAGRGGLERIAGALDIPLVLLIETKEHPEVSQRGMQLAKELESCTSRELDIIWEMLLCLKKSLRSHQEP
ncbi:MAG: helix-turn-helix domain-containing protein [Lachnospiraceae bacterium]